MDETERGKRLKDAEKTAQEIGFSILPISETDPRLQIDVQNCAATFGDAELARLEPISGVITWLDLGRSQVTDSGLGALAKMPQLERLHLEETGVTDRGIEKLAPLTKLTYINLFGTKITDATLAHLEGMKGLHKLFVWQTGITEASARDFQRRMSLEVSIGTMGLKSQPAPPKASPVKTNG